jgi:hypothetical protein
VSKRYLEPVEVEQHEGRPRAFRWREASYSVLAVLGHWREDARTDRSLGLAVPQRELWRVEARRAGPARGVYELVHEGGAWRLGRIWD